jgi:hypothetical protein
MTTTYKWFERYSAAVLETDWSKIDNRISAVEAEIQERLREFSLNHGGSPEENRAIVDALDRLKALRADVASWRESNLKP